jgi:hypothetical protein
MPVHHHRQAPIERKKVDKTSIEDAALEVKQKTDEK